MTLLLANSKKQANEPAVDQEDDQKQSKPAVTFYERLFSDAVSMKPIELFHLRFYHHPQSFYFFEAL